MNPNQINRVRPSSPRTTVQVRLTDGRIAESAPGATLEEFACALNEHPDVPYVGALVSNSLQELTVPVWRDSDVELIDISDKDGMRIYRRSLVFLLVAAVSELFPGAWLYVDHSMTFGGLFCRLEGHPPFTPQELAQLYDHMRDLVKQNLPIQREEMPIEQAAAEFRAHGDEEKARLLENSDKQTVAVYQLGTHRNHFHGYMAPSTGYLKYFDLVHYPPGFVLYYPRRVAPTHLAPFQSMPRLTQVFQQYREWLELLDVKNLPALNNAIDSGRIREVVLVTEALHEQRVAAIASVIASHRDQIGMVLIAGPSSSGKTTFARRLSVQLMANGIHPIALGLDNWFVDREQTPLDEYGMPDFECLEAIDLALFNEQLNQMLAGKTVTLPNFDFRIGRKVPGETLRVTPNHVVLIEGIHGLNPNLVPDIPSDRIFRIYISALTQLNLDRHNRVSTTDTRIIRRIVRDAARRGYTATETIARWPSVERGEWRNIFPYQEHADVMFNSALVYELAALRSLAEPLLLSVEPGTAERVEADRLLSLLRWFRPCPTDIVPDNSILREFIGGSILEDFRPWQRRDNGTVLRGPAS
ncbi:MAG: nucleoside kinase [Anaerolineae bacterium]|nr:nucleoside kinase [Anaerolineae bacterium]MCB9133512.1 nucleoside kinase [Anaerolineales bacterium]MCB0230067.1 nucleoside kinase [Anaerolineae bacterium]MCB0233806.1 nucleoside kinase [Anaerolineae bacterium]MCB0237445.1 nucleoside kinase [Anaerolineae bacterium]